MMLCRWLFFLIFPKTSVKQVVCTVQNIPRSSSDTVTTFPFFKKSYHLLGSFEFGSFWNIYPIELCMVMDSYAHIQDFSSVYTVLYTVFDAPRLYISLHQFSQDFVERLSNYAIPNTNICFSESNVRAISYMCLSFLCSRTPKSHVMPYDDLGLSFRSQHRCFLVQQPILDDFL